MLPMAPSNSFVRLLFSSLCTVFLILSLHSSLGSWPESLVLGLAGGLLFTVFLLLLERATSRFDLRALNTSTLGIAFGILFGQCLLSLLNLLQLEGEIWNFAQAIIFLAGVYVGVQVTHRAAGEIHLSIPFVQFKPTREKKRDLLIDGSVLSDARILDLASSGLLDDHLLVPRFLIRELQEQAESADENRQGQARRALDVLRKLEGTTGLNLKYHDQDIPGVKDPLGRLVKLARILDANLLTADIKRIQMAEYEGVRIINMHSLSNALKPLMQTGEFLKIKIQRLGKEARQGVGYLENGTMVVVNGGGDYMGRTISARVLSVKHTSSGRMIFCNANEQEMAEESIPEEALV